MKVRNHHPDNRAWSRLFHEFDVPGNFSTVIAGYLIE